MPSAWTFGGPVSRAGGVITLVEGNSFCISGRLGDFAGEGAVGFFHDDTRFLSTWQLHIDGAPVEFLAVMPAEPYHATFLCRARPHGGLADSRLLVQRDRYVGVGVREDIVVRNLGDEPAGLTVTILADTDFADIFAVKEGRPVPFGERSVVAEAGELRIDAHAGDVSRGVRIEARPADGAFKSREGLAFRAVVPAAGTWRVAVRALPVVNGVVASPSYPFDRPVDLAPPVRRLADWRRDTPVISTPYEPLRQALDVTENDLGSLRIVDPAKPDIAIVAAGAPWFMTVFGRDSLLTSIMALPVDPRLAAGTLQTLAGLQGSGIDPLTEEEPGRIPHELRGGVDATRALGGRTAYYGTVDATPLFVMALGAYFRWTGDVDLVKELLPHADRALDWAEEFGDKDHDGFVEYRRATDKGLFNQGWKDSFDGINFAAGQLAEPPIALAEVQGYLYSAFIERAHLARCLGDTAGAERFGGKAAQLRAAFNERFWLPERGWYAVGLDRHKEPIDALASNMAHCLWTGIVDDDKAASVGRALVSPSMFSGWGVRTLADGMVRYNPMSYHNGSVWPHDNAIAVAGLARYGMTEEANRVAIGVLDAGVSFAGRLPELLCGFGRDEFSRPVPYPAACSPQAWAAAAPLLMLRAMLGLGVCVPCGSLRIDPVIPPNALPMKIDNMPLGGERITISIDENGPHVSGLPDGVSVTENDHRCEGLRCGV